MRDRCVLYTTDPYETICRIAEFAKRRVRIISINTRTPTLEDAFLKILGVKALVIAKKDITNLLYQRSRNHLWNSFTDLPIPSLLDW